MTLEERLAHFAEATPDAPALLTPSERFTYRTLFQAITLEADQMAREGVQPRSAYVFCSTQDARFVIRYCAVHWLGAVAVPLAAATPPSVVEEVRQQVSHLVCPTSVVDILFTTGTTGTAKGVMLSANAWTANAENLLDRHPYTPDLLFLTSGPLNHLGCLSKLHATLFVGATLYVLPNIKDLKAFFEVFHLPFPRVATFLVPSSLRMLLLLAKKALLDVADKITFIETGAAPLAPRDRDLLCALLPHTQLFNTYASTETGIVSSQCVNSQDIPAACVGTPMRHSSLRLAIDGRVVCSGDTLMTGYLHDEAATRSVLHDGELFTSDLGWIDTEGRLVLQGRMGDVINVGGYKVNPTEVEDVVSQHPEVSDCICLPVAHPVTGTTLKVLYVPRHPSSSLSPRQLALFLQERLASYQRPTQYQAVDAICHTPNGKPDRKAYSTH